MPIYTYECQECKEKFDKLAKSIKEGENIEREGQCPKCSTVGKLKRVWPDSFGTPIFKGHGFYKTDYTSRSSNDKE